MLHYETITPYLHKTLLRLMSDSTFNQFRLVGGTSLSLRLGHRMSIDIDLFSNADYGSIDFHALQNHIRTMFPYCVGDCGDVAGFGATYIVGEDRNNAVKLDLFYTDDFIAPLQMEEGIRMASINDIVAMKLDVIAQGGRKKDFWDIHELLQHYKPSMMLDFYEKRYPYGYSRKELVDGFANYVRADNEPDPMCLRGKEWDEIKRDLSAAFGC